MRLRTQINVLIVVAALALPTTLSITIVSLRGVERTTNNIAAAELVIANATELRQIAVDTVLFHEARAPDQWDRKIKAVRAALDTFPAAKAGERAALERMKGRVDLAQTIYPRLAVPSASVPVAVDAALEARTVTSLFVITQEILDTGSDLIRDHRAEALEKIRDLYLALGLVLLAIVALTAFAWRLVIRGVLHPIRVIESGTHRVAAGDYTYRLNLRAGNEIGDLASAFDAMTAEVGQLSERLRIATQSARVGIWDYDIVNNSIVWDDVMLSLYGIRREEFGGAYEAWRAGVHPEDQAQGDAEIAAAIAGGKAFDTMFRVVWPSGEVRHIKAFGVVLRDGDGNPQRMIGINFDITPLKRNETELAVQRSRLNNIIEGTNVGTWEWNVQSGAVVFNERWADIIGYTLDELAPISIDTWTRFIHPDDVQRSGELLDRHFKGDLSYYECEVRMQHKNGHWVWVLDRGRVASWTPEGKPLLMSGTHQNISERKNAETALLAAKQAAEDANRAKSNFLATMSHEIRTPMNGILGMLKLLQHTELTSRQIDYTRKAEGATQALLGIINDILDFSKVEAGKLELDDQPFVIGDLLRELSVILSANLGSKDVEVLFELATDVPPVLIGDSLRLRQVLINLAGNALKFTEQGEVVLSIRMLKREADQVELEFSIRDTGIGIAADKLGYIFEGFSQAETTTSRRFGGTGLGLAISQRLVALMGGTLAVESESGKGSRFYFSLRLGIGPVLAVATATQNQQQAEASPLQALLIPGGAGLRVLIVDDNALSREILMEMAIAMGWQVECSVSGDAALAHLEQADAPHYDIVLMDWRMPGMDGWETTRKIRQLKHRRQAPVVIMVTAASRELLSKKSTLETNLIDGYLVKPITASMLYEAVAEAIVERKGEHIRHSVVHASAQLAGLRLLVVEDNLLNQQIAQELLERCGAQVTIAGGGLAGVEQAVAADPPFDAILMDVQMPDIDGLEATRRVRAVHRMRDVPIIAMTANAMEADKEICRAVGMVDHVSKPIDLDALITTVLRHTGHNRTGAVAPAPTFETLSQPVSIIAKPASGMDASFIDVDAAIKRMGGSQEFYDQVVLSFRSDAAELVAELQRYITMMDHAQAMRAAHTLKGLAATVGAMAFCAQAEQIETTLKNMLADTDTVNAAHLVDLSTCLATQLTQVLAAFPQPLPPSVSGQAEHGVAAVLDRGNFVATLQELRASLKLRDMRATKLGEQLRQQFGGMLDTDQLEQLSALEQALGRLDFAKAMDACDALLSGFH